jgi:hypothetical protein
MPVGCGMSNHTPRDRCDGWREEWMPEGSDADTSVWVTDDEGVALDFATFQIGEVTTIDVADAPPPPPDPGFSCAGPPAYLGVSGRFDVVGRSNSDIVWIAACDRVVVVVRARGSRRATMEMGGSGCMDFRTELPSVS